MSASQRADLQDSATAGLASQSDQPAGQSVLTPFCGKLNVDEMLKLSNEKFNEKIHDYFKDKHITPLSQLTAVPPFPTPHVFAQFSSKTYSEYKTRETDTKYEKLLALPAGWKLLTTASNGSKTNGYFGAAYWHPEHQQVVIAHRGTKLTNFGALWTDAFGVFLKNHVPQMCSASTFAHKVVEVLREVNRKKGVSFQLFFTGHSLGGWLAQVTTFTTEYLKREGNFFLRSNDDNDCYHPHTVVFDSPGCKNMLSEMRDTFDVRLDGRSIDLEHLDITSYLSAPNRINTCNAHLGTVYRIFPDLSDMGWWKKHTLSYNTATHNVQKIVEAFDPERGQVHKDEQGQLRVQVVVDWPICPGLKRGKEYKNFFEWAKHLNNYHPDIKDVSFQHLCLIRYQTKIYDERVNNLCIFSEKEQEFLQSYYKLRQWPEFFKPKELFSVMGDSQAQEDAERILQNFVIESNTVCCKNAIELQNLIPYVKRLLQLFPGLEEFTNRVYQCETRSCIEQMKQSPLDFNPDALSVREFLENKQQRVLQVQMVVGDEWTGLIKVYQVLQKNNCLMESQYTILKLERLLTLNMLMDFRTIIQSIKAPYLILVACEANQLLKAETKDMIRTIFETMKQKPFIKIILTTRSEDRATPFLQNISRDKFGDAFVTKVEQLTWSDLTTTSQEKLLEKTATFQGVKISLNALMSTESPVANLLSLGALLEEEELKIADLVPISSGYNESYYIGRTFRYQKTIKREIFSDIDVKEKRVSLASAEQKFRQLSHLNPNIIVHWLEKDETGKLVWQQSQGSLETIRRYIDTKSSHIYTADNLDKLLEQAQHQRAMLISDTAGMGKSTVLTHLSKEIKQKFPGKWVVRIDLNDHTEVLKALKKEQIDKEKAIEFVSEKVLKLETGLNLELFKKCCEQKQKVGIVIMLDGFDEISPSYKETVLALLQALRQTAVEQMWVTTRPHLREELEDKLQQLSCTLEPFSEENQVEFLKKFWSLKDWFTEPEVTEEKNKLGIYAEYLIKKLAVSISDKDRELTGIPLLTRMLAEAFDENVRMFCRSVESTHELPFKLDLLELYERFIERKYDIYQEEKLQVRMSNMAGIGLRERDLKIVREGHQLLALKVLFTEEIVALFQNIRESSFSTEDLTRIGIVQVSYDGKLHFIHRTFAEYFVADCLVNRLTEGNNISEQVETFILKEIFLGREYRVIRVFVDCLMSCSKPLNEVLKQYGNRICGLGKYAEIILHLAVYEGNANIVDMLLDSVGKAEHTDVLKELLLAQDEGRTVCHLAALGGNIQVLQVLQNWAKKKLTTEEINNKLLLATDNWGRTVWHVAAKEGKLDLLQNIWVWAKKNLTKEEINNKLLLATDGERRTAWHVAAEEGKLDILQKIWEWAKRNQTKEEINNKLLLAKDKWGNTVWYVATKEGKLDILQKIWECAKENLTTQEINTKLLLATDGERRTVWHVAVDEGKIDVLQKIWEWSKETLTKEEVNNKLLLATDNWGRTVWYVAAKEGKLELLQKIWECAKENLTTEEINRKILLTTYSAKRTDCHVASEGGNLDLLQTIREWAKENLTAQEINNKLFLAKNICGDTIWNVVAETGKLDLLQKIWEWAKENLTSEEINNKLLLAKDKWGKTVWYVAAKEGKLELLQKIWDCAKEIMTTEEINNNLLLAKDNWRRTVWYVAAKEGKLDVLQKIWECAKEILTTEEINNKLLLAKDDWGRTVWYVAAEEGKLEVLQKVWEWAKENLTTEELNYKLLLAKDKWGKMVWHVAAKEGKLDVLQKIWEGAKENLTTQEINNKLLLAKDEKGKTVWYVAAEEGKPDLLQKVWELAKENLTTEELNKKLLLAKDEKGRTVWFVAAEEGKPDLLQKVWELAKETLTTEELNNKLLLAEDKWGRTVWYVAAKEGKPDLLQKVWEMAKEILTREEINNKFLLAKDDWGRTVWYVAAKEGKQNVLLKVWEWAKENLTTEEINNELLLAKLKWGKTAWYVAVEEGHLDVLQKIWECAKENLTTGEINNKLLLAKDKWGKTVWNVAAKKGNLDLLEKIWECAKETLTLEEINNKLLLDRDVWGRNVWYMAAEEGKLEVLQKIWECAKENLTTEELINKLLLAKDKWGNTVWYVAAKEGRLDLLQNIWDRAKEILTTEEINNKLLLAKDKWGDTIWNMAAKEGKLDILQKIGDFAKENLTTEEINKNFY